MLSRVSLSFLSLFIIFASSGQDIDYARNVIQELCSPEMHGRGYYKQGDALAAKYIASEFQNAGLHKFNDSYFQEYSFGINTIKGKVAFSVDGKSLIPGEEFLVSCSAPPIKGKYQLVFEENSAAESEAFLVTTDNIRIIENERMDSIENFEGIISLRPVEENMWWHVSNGRKVSNLPVFIVRADLLPASAKEVKVSVHSEFVEDYKTHNVIGFFPGKAEPDSFIVFTAHYDHLGRMGKDVYYPGANDNASGTAMVMDMARHFSQAGNQSDYSMVFVALSGEEAGLMGATYLAENPLFDLDKIKFLINMDMVGTGGEGITVVNGKVFEEEFNLLKEINEEEQYLKEVAIRGESCNSDHCPFYMKGVPAVFIYSRSKEFNEYHNLADNSETLPLTEYEDLFRLLVSFTERL